MNIVRCAAGHYYDGERFSDCPHCNVPTPKPEKTEEKKETVQIPQIKEERTPDPDVTVRFRPDEISPSGKTYGEEVAAMASSAPNYIPKKNDSGIQKIVPIDRNAEPQKILPLEPEQPMQPQVQMPRPQVQLQPQVQMQPQPQVQISQPQLQVQMQPQPQVQMQPRPQVQIQPPVQRPQQQLYQMPQSIQSDRQEAGLERNGLITGWLIGISGEMYGKALTLYAEDNWIGKDLANRWRSHSSADGLNLVYFMIGFDMHQKQFIYHGDIRTGKKDSTPIYLNDIKMDGNSPLRDMDRLIIQDNTFRLILLCKDGFSWWNEPADSVSSQVDALQRIANAQTSEFWSCPICSSKNHRTQGYCLTCGWEK